MVKLLSALLLVVGLCSSAAAKETTGSENQAPSFSLPDTKGKSHSLADYKGKVIVLEWFNSGCPFVKKHYESGNMQRLQQQAIGKGAVWFTIVSSAPGKQGHATPAEHDELLRQWKASPTAFLIDEDGAVGKAYEAKTTPHMYVINTDGKIAYQGAIDNKPSTDIEDIAASQNYVTGAIDAVLAGTPVKPVSTEAYGCSIKYKA